MSGNRQALVKMVVVGISTCLGLSLTYAVPVLDAYRPWVPGEPVPFAMWWGGNPKPDDEVEVAEEFLAEARAAEAEGEEEDGVLAPPPTVEAIEPPSPVVVPGPVVEPAPVVLPAPVVQPAPDNATAVVEDNATVVSDNATVVSDNATVVSDNATVASDNATQPTDNATVVPPAPKRPTVVVDAKEYEGITREIEDPSGKALDSFYASLEKTALRQAGAVTRISHWGASVIGADGMTSVARRKLQKRFGSAGKGWVNMAPGWDWYRQKDVVFKSTGWRGKTVTSHKLKRASFGNSRYGYGGVAAVGYRGAKSTYRVWAKRLELYYHAYQKGGDVSVSIDGGEPQIISTKADTAVDGYAVIEAPTDGEHTFEVKAAGGGVAHVYGVTLERDGPGIVYDCLGMIGTRASRILNYEPEHLAEQVSHRNPDLQIIMFGGNELQDHGMNMRLYEEKYERVIQSLRAGAPNASCLMMTPVDHGEKVRGRVRTVRMLLKMIPAQQRIAERQGCAFFNTFEAMGGEGSIGRWYYKIKPRLAWGDFAHLTKAGDRVMGSMIYKAIMKGFAGYLSRNAR
ncbi:MAG: lysophospholipase L1-like esterase [Myxococcota bacterium]|jgi:lysophospholipase L1-like esterase